MRKIFSHLRTDWYKYIIQAGVVISGIIIAFGLEKWHLSSLENEQFLDAYELIAQEIKIDTGTISKNIHRFKKRRNAYESIINGTMTAEEFDACYYCPRMVTSLYFIYPTDKGYQHLVNQSDYRFGYDNKLNRAIEAYYNEVHQMLPMWQKFIYDDITQNIENWKRDMSWYHQREDRPEDMIDYQFNDYEYKNMVYVQRNLIYKNYLPLLEKMYSEAIEILKLINQKVEEER